MALVQVVPFAGKQTYVAAATFTPAATPTDLVTIAGASGKIIRVMSIKLTTTNTAAGSQEYTVIKRSALDTTGTFVAATRVPIDSSNASAAATVGHYTANPGGLGAAVGNINVLRLASPAAVPASFAAIALDAGYELLPIALFADFTQLLTLRTAVENIAVNFAGAALVAGQTHGYTIMWTEE